MTVRILGIDPGTAATGFGVVDVTKRVIQPIWYDCLRTKASDSPGKRLVQIQDAVEDILKHLKPDVVAIETLFFGASAKAALAVGQARGVCIATCTKAGLEVFEYTPATIKQSVTGYGRADKEQIGAMVQATLKMSEIPKPDHAADALAIAITHAGARPILHPS